MRSNAFTLTKAALAVDRQTEPWLEGNGAITATLVANGGVHFPWRWITMTDSLPISTPGTSFRFVCESFVGTILLVGN